jgi:hypothetical protein
VAGPAGSQASVAARPNVGIEAMGPGGMARLAAPAFAALVTDGSDAPGPYPWDASGWTMES